MASQNPQNSLGNAWELSLYELHRKPHEMVSDTSAIAVSPRSLHSELMCPICLDLMQNTQTTKECLHRFCQECIITALRSGNKECPTCRKKLVSKRSLRPDPNFDKLIAKIYPNREELNTAEQEKQLGRKSHSLHRRKRRADSPPTAAGKSELDGHAGKRRKVDEEADMSVTPPPSNDSSSSEQVELQLRPHPEQKEVSEFTIKTLATSPLCTVSHLVRYIGINLASEGKGEARGDYNLHAQVGEDYVCLPVSTTLRQIEDMYSEYSGGKLKLFFTASNERDVGITS